MLNYPTPSVGYSKDWMTLIAMIILKIDFKLNWKSKMVFCDCIFSHQEFLLTCDLKKWPPCKRWAGTFCMPILQHLSILFSQKQCHFWLYMAFYVISLLLYLIDPVTQDNKAHRTDVEKPLSRHSWKCSSPP